MLGLRPCLLIFLLTACEQDPLFADDQIAGWANSASALGVFAHGYEPLAVAAGEIEFDDPACPMTTDDGTTLAIRGNGCVDVENRTWVGSAVLTRQGSESVIRFEGYGKGEDPDTIPELTGDFTLNENAPENYTFVADLDQRGGIDMEINYWGTVLGGNNLPTLWNGQGTVSRDGPAIYSGSVEAITVDQLRDNSICPGEGISGRTTLLSLEYQVDILYDGADDCDGDYSARWRRDGELQGTLSGISCATVVGRSRPTSTGFLLLAFLCLVGLRRYRSAVDGPLP